MINENKEKALLGTAIGGLILIIVITIFGSFFNFWLGYFTGWLAENTVGDKLIEAINTMFNTNYFKTDMLPIIGGALGWISSFFKVGATTRLSNDISKKLND